LVAMVCNNLERFAAVSAGESSASVNARLLL